MTRANARELAVHLIYGRDFTGEDPQEVNALRLNKEYYNKLSSENQVYTERPTSLQKAYIDKVVDGVANRSDELNACIQKYSIGWDVSRISRLTSSIMQLAIFEILYVEDVPTISRLARCVMQLAIYEILYVEDVPTGVAISEAVRLVKKYDGNDTGSFVNGILGSFAREEVEK